MATVSAKAGVKFDPPSGAPPDPGGFVIDAALVFVARSLGWNLVITSACDGEHSGPDDPHHFGRARDIRTHDVPDKQQLVTSIINTLADWYPGKFYTFIEAEDTPNEHIHSQVRHGMEIT